MSAIRRTSMRASERPVASVHRVGTNLRRSASPLRALVNIEGGSDAIRFCSRCGARVEIQVLPHDHLPRHVCPACSRVQYRNPRVIVGIIPETDDGRIVMCRRAIPPRPGLWTFPAGHLENGETGEQGATREAQEEAGIIVEPLGLYMVIHVLPAQEVHLVYRGRLRASVSRIADLVAAGPESAEVRMASENDMPWRDLAYTAIGVCLRRYFADRTRGQFPVHTLHVVDGETVLGAGDWSSNPHVD